MVDRVLTLPAGTRLLVLGPVVRGRKGEYRKLFFDLRRQGFSRARVDGVVHELTEDIELDRNRKHTIEVVVDRLVVRDNLGRRLADPLETALRLADGVVQVEPVEAGVEPFIFSERLACAECGVSFPEVSPRMFSFNNPYGAGPACGGFGTRYEVDPGLLVPNPNRSLKDGALAAWAGRESVYFKQTLQALARRYRFALDAPWSKLPKKTREVILHGDPDGGFEGVVKVLDRRYRETLSEETRQEVEHFMRERACPACRGARLRPESLAVVVGGRSIADLARFTIKEAARFFAELHLSERDTQIARRVLKEIRERRRHPLGRRGTADPARDADRLEPGRGPLHPGRAEHRAPPAGQPEAPRHAPPAPGPRQYRPRGRARRGDDPLRRLRGRPRAGRGRARRAPGRGGHAG